MTPLTTKTQAYESRAPHSRKWPKKHFIKLIIHDYFLFSHRDPKMFSSNNNVILCSYSPIVMSIRENIRTAVLKYVPNEVRSVRKTKVRIFSRMNRTNWSIRAPLYSHSQRSRIEAFSKFSTERICAFLECSCSKGNFSSSSISAEVKLSLKKVKSALKLLSSIFFY